MNFNTAYVFVIFGACLASRASPKSDYSSSNLLDDYAKFSDELVPVIANSSEGNFIVSPMSLAQTLTIASCGAAHETLRQLQKVLHASTSIYKAARASRELILRLKKETGVTVQLLNSLIVNKKYTLLPHMMKVIEFGFQSKIRNDDFTDGEKVANGINEYVEDGTHGTIKDLVTADMFDKNTVMVAVNVLYFQSKWLNFQDLPEWRNFHLSNGSVVQTPMIRANGYYRYYERDNYKMIQIPFLNENFAMTLVMPMKHGYIIPPSLSESLRSMHESYDLAVTIPKFIIESEHNLVETMTDLGVGRMFGPEAEFSRFTGKNGLYVSTLIQKAYINVTSGGVEASAATVMDVDDRMGGIEPSRSVRFDRPFVAYITYESMPLFAMRVTDPRP